MHGKDIAGEGHGSGEASWFSIFTILWSNADSERHWLFNIAAVFVNEFQAKTTTYFAVHGHAAPLHPRKAFLLTWNETQTPKSTQIEQ